jgi:hypothetical protein
LDSLIGMSALPAIATKERTSGNDAKGQQATFHRCVE